LREPRPLGFRFASSCEPDNTLRSGCHPCLVAAESAPPGFQPGTPVFCCGCHRFSAPSATLPTGCSHLAAPTALPDLRHVCFRRRPDACSGQHATPETLWPNQSLLVISPGPTSTPPECWRLSPRRLSVSVVRLSPHGSRNPRGLCDTSVRRHPSRAQVGTLPLHLRLCRAA